ncbi:MAG TPA: hypothetical protein DDW76_07530 [Cyanobacteria bacterium UBA11369]|nr:hypothetical protein [Cyanobacteria bacterium UBA11371]HBE33730.1 hypothetical protein [Cyanobacteria bacterium UBA11368]HBE48634.1 hypothetical protein [Cyanobacteria bacterium UBA11369]
MNIKQNFQNQIVEELFSGNLSEEKACFLRRFAPENHPDNKASTHKVIAKLMKDDLGVYCEEKISQTIRKVIEVIHKAYGDEMKADGVNTEALLNLKAGGTLKGEEDEERHKKFSPWKEVYNWLWNHKYLRWLDANSWEILQKKAKSAPNWLKFKTTEEILALHAGTKAPTVRTRKAPEIKPTIPANESLLMEIDLEYPNYQLLLFNRSQQGKILLCPSFVYAVNPIIEKPPILLPQKDRLEDTFMFEEMGKEEFLAIVLEKHLSLPWLTPREEEDLPTWNAERIKELFEQLEQQDSWQVFYQNFEVVK